MTAEQLIQLGASDDNAHKYITHLNKAMGKYAINTPLRMAHFLAQLFHESGCLHYSEEIADGKAYEGREDLGNKLPGDGKRFKGRGLIQITGRLAYVNYGMHLGINIQDTPELVGSPSYATDSAAWFWSIFKKDKAGKSLNDMADEDLFLRITYFVNGGFNGIEDRLKNLKRAYALFSIPDAEMKLKKIVDTTERNLSLNPRVNGMDKALFKAVPDLGAVNKLRKVIA